ncbi:DeoR/GlpR family DNA-binding transcription regulator [Anaerotruncus rubiinfantis]|uniref:DeoR/GlpR family DNA-binding transcription regulator n=1 Tax=Anaerotruncus rubiinfantis TaxID=1720200 RepID=UPI0034A0ED3E
MCMLAEERFAQILELVAQKRTVSVQELTKLLDTSESTIRRDLNLLDERGLLVKVFGGATASDALYNTRDDTVETRADQNREEKIRIARYAASLLQKGDFVFFDAGTTTGLMIDFITEKDIVFVTDGLSHAKKLAQKGCTTFMLCGELKASTDAVVGGQTLRELERYNFTKGFFGTNGVHLQNGFSTPDTNEALVKEKAIQRCKQRYVLSDPSKFNRISPVTFAPFSCATVITTRLQDERYRKYTNIREVDAE